MKHVSWWPKLLIALAVASAAATSAAAVEPVDQFLTALCQQGLFDEALDYLDRLGANEHLDESVRQTVLYRQGLVVLQSAAGLKEPVAREATFAKACELFGRFLTEFPQHDLAGAAQIQVANISMRRARAGLESTEPSAPQEAALAAARKTYIEAARQFDEAEKLLSTRLGELPKLVDPADANMQSRKQQITGDIAQVRLLRPTVDYELATTFALGSADAKQPLQAAARGYAGLAETYRTRTAGLLARLWQGRCHQQLGELKQALGCFRELMDQPVAEATRDVKTQSTRHALECLTSDSEKKYPEAIERGQRWEQDFGQGPTDADALAIRYLTALAYQAQSSALPDKDPDRKKLAGYARQYVMPVANQPGQYQQPAKLLLVALGANKEAPQKDVPQVTFAEALQQAEQALAQMQEVDAALREQQGKADDAALQSLRGQKEASAAQARRLLQAALATADSKANAEEISSVRYYLCFLAWDAGRLYDAAVLGEHLLRRYPDSPRGRQGARIALEAYLRLFNESKLPDKEFEAAHVARVGEEILKRWPGEEEADTAALLLLSFSASRQQWDKAIEYLKRVSVDSPNRGQAELRAGQSLWSAYLRGSQLPEGERPPQPQLDALKQQAQEVLGQGIARMEKADKVDATLAAATFAMAQIAVETGQPDKAIAWLERPKFGPVTLVKAKSPIAARDTFAIEAYKLALRAYIAVEPQQLAKAEETMNSLEKLVGGAGDAKAAENLTAIYIGLGRELEKHLQDLRKTGQTKQLETVSKAFEIFLDRVTKRETGNSFASLNWVGETYFSLGGGLDEGTPTLPPKAKEYFKKATTAYERLLAMAEQDPQFKDAPDRLISVRLRLADCHRRSGNFEAATKIILDILHQKPMLLAAQVQAAETYQASGVKDLKGYALAIQGTAPGGDGKNVVWGWAKLSKMTMNQEKFAGTFHQARLKMAESRHRFGVAQQDAVQRNKIVEAAKQDLWFTYKLHPDLGGSETSAQYDRLLKQIQHDLAQPEVGLEEFRQRDAAASTAEASAAAK